ncbi:MAG TPA: class I SAM-dependent methyltransferase [Actinomycetota bacterium]
MLVDYDYSSLAWRDERVFTYLPLEREILQGFRPGALILDLGCGDGSHMGVLATGGRVVGSDVSVAALREARQAGPVAGAEGERLPFRDRTFDLVHVSHVLHHARDFEAVLYEVGRVLKPTGYLVLIETCEDSPVMRLARALRPEWESVPVRSRFRYAELVQAVQDAGFVADITEQFNVLYWIWGFARRRLRPLERLVGTVVRLELAAARRFRAYSAYGYVIARKRGG